ncbi:peptidylprolyl isomerase [Flavobacteriaceae bacterium]|nr:peptidylprolyl isomerase [Flavobacteriaceae bacterium]
MKKNLAYIALFTFFIFSCKKEDVVEPPRDFGDQAIADEQSLEDFLSTHFYNYEDFLDSESQPELVIETLSGENADKTPLIEQVRKEVIRLKTSEDSFVDHTVYTLVAREGSGVSPSSVDSIYLSYEGILLNRKRFDRSFAPVWFDLTSLVRGFREGVTVLKSGEFSVDEYNVPVFSNYGQGAIFMPSGLGYFNSARGAIPSYSPLIFKIDLYLVKQTDHDGDGILSVDEFDRDGDGIADDTDQDGIPDYLDAN